MRSLVLVLCAATGVAAQERITLEEAVRRALARNPTTLVAAQEIDRAEGLLWQARAPALPQLGANATATRNDAARSAGSGVLVPRESFNANLQLVVPLLAPARWTAWGHGSDAVEVARVSLEEVRRTVAVATARAYLVVIAQHRLVTINVQARDAARNHFEDAKAKLEVGSGNRLDVVRSAQEVATDEAQVASSLAQLVRTREALGVLVGDEGPVEVTEEVTIPAPPAEATAMEDAQARRQDVRAARQRTKAAENIDRDWWQDYLPLVQGVVQPFYQNPATLTAPETGWSAQLVLSLPIFDGGIRTGLHRANGALAAESRAQLDGLLRQARSDVRTGFDTLRRADEGLVAARDAARLAHDALAMTALAYREGATNDLEVVDAERRARDADTAALIAEDTARQARIDLLTATGRFP